MTAPLVVGIDPSITATGLAYANGALATITHPKHVTGDRRLQRIYECICAAVDGAALAVVEDLPTHAHGAGITGMAQGVVRLALLKHRVPYILIPPATVKVYACGRGNATKADMRLELFKRTGRDLRDDNQVDACWLRYFGLHLLGFPEIDLPASHLRAFDKVTWPPLAVAT